MELKLFNIDEAYDEEADLTINEILDKALRVARRAQATGSTRVLNPAFESRAGYGKTTMIEDWAKKAHVNLVYIKANTLDPAEMNGILARDPSKPDTSTRLANTEWDVLDMSDTVVFVDEFNRARQDVIEPLLQLIGSHKIVDPRVKPYKVRELPNLLFTVGACNPFNAKYGGTRQTDTALSSRFKIYNENQLTFKSSAVEDYLTKKYTNFMDAEKDPAEKAVYAGILDLIGKIFENKKKIVLTSAEDELDLPDNVAPLNPRNLEDTLVASEGKTRDFLRHLGNLDPKAVELLHRILDNFETRADKATDVLNTDFSNSNDDSNDPFVANMDLYDKILDIITVED